MRFVIKEVISFPKEYQSGILYWSKEFEMSAHKCACGCGDVIQIPVDAQNFRITGTSSNPTVRPSIGNWGVCDSHYYITAGNVEWLPKLSAEQISIGRTYEDARRKAHYEHMNSSFWAPLKNRVRKFWEWLRSF